MADRDRSPQGDYTSMTNARKFWNDGADRTPQDDADVIREIDRIGREVRHARATRWPPGDSWIRGYAEDCEFLLALLAEKDALLTETTRENTALRGIASKIMPCHFCGAEEIAMCPKGFPGCALMDDVMGMEEGVMIALREARAEIGRLDKERDAAWTMMERARAERDALAAQVRTHARALRVIADWCDAALASVQQPPDEEQT